MTAGTPVLDARRPRRRWRRAVLGGVLLGASLAGVAITGGPMLSRAIGTIGDLDLPWLPLALLAETSSMGAFARAQRRLLRAGGLNLHLTSVTAITYAGNAISVSLPIAGAEAGTAFAFGQFRHRGADPALASWALAVSGLISSFTFGLLLAGGAFASGSATLATLGLIGAGVSVAPGVVALLALRYPPAHRSVSWAATAVIGGLSRLTHTGLAQPRALVDAFLDRLAGVTLPARYFAEVFALLLTNWVMDCMCLAVAIRATGAAIPWQGLFLAYGAGAGAAIVPVTPGGVGAVELALSAALVSAGLQAPHALAAVVVYRLISFWLVAAVGFGILAALSRSRPQLEHGREP